MAALCSGVFGAPYVSKNAKRFCHFIGYCLVSITTPSVLELKNDGYNTMFSYLMQWQLNTIY
ncbi:hypothetical protein BML2537_06480 [Providencia stuartii]|nr:hypothetical protein BML2537_06480 [Providencia stuartii]